MMRRTNDGYILIATILLGLGLSVVAGTFLQYTTFTSERLNGQQYNALAREAADAGVSYANYCLSSGQAPATGWTSALSPKTTCTGGAQAGYVTTESEWRSTFTVSQPTSTPDGRFKSTVTGTVEILGPAGITVKTIREYKVALFNAVTAAFDQSRGATVTEVKADTTACAIANGKLYCWGDDTQGQIGDGYKGTTPRPNPVLIGHGAGGSNVFNGKYISKVSVGDRNVCAIADGSLYCWGDGLYNQIGDGTTTDRSTPTLIGQGAGGNNSFLGKKVTEVSTAAQVSIPGGGTTTWHTCAIADGIPYCWGDNNFAATGQVTFGGSAQDTLKTPSPARVYGYSTGDSQYQTSQLYGKKVDRIAAGGHASCAVVQSQQYCWGYKIPLAPPSPAKPYNTNWNGGDLIGKFIDPATWEGSADYACSMANSDFVCFGKPPGTSPGGNWYTVFTGPTTMTVPGGTDVTTHENGDNPVTAPTGTNGPPAWFCYIANGNPGCRETDGYWSSAPYHLIDRGSNVPTRIATGTDGKHSFGTDLNYYACAAANGKLVCTGSTGSGQLADGNNISSTTQDTFAVKGTSGSNPIGSETGTLAAHNSISVGNNHSCAVANGHAYCWGDNSKGQLGITGASSPTPTAVGGVLLGKVVTQISAGGDHTCAVAEGQLYCWGDNANNEIGNNSTQIVPTPLLIGEGAGGSNDFANKRMTYVNAGPTGTCAIAEGQLYCWGNNSSGQLGTGDNVSKTTPTRINNGSSDIPLTMGVYSVSMGTTHTCAIAQGNLYCWGENSKGQLGIGNNTDKLWPTLVNQGTAATTDSESGLTAYASLVSAGDGFTCAVLNSFLNCWGDNNMGQTGTGNGANFDVPTRLTDADVNGKQVNALTTGNSHACAVVQGNTYCWGNNLSCRVGHQSCGGSKVYTPEQANTIDRDGNASFSTAISAGYSSTCSITNGDILCWGDGTSGKLGNGSTSTLQTPTLAGQYISASTLTRGPVF